MFAKLQKVRIGTLKKNEAVETRCTKATQSPSVTSLKTVMLSFTVPPFLRSLNPFSSKFFYISNQQIYELQFYIAWKGFSLAEIQTI